VDILLDTHVFLWWDSRSPKLSAPAQKLIAAPANRVFVSAASIWEIAIKRRLGKLDFEGSPTAAVRANGFVELEVSGADAETAGSLDWAHPDPFDRLILAQATSRQLTVITADEVMKRYMGVAIVAA